ncbi:hypothetical protein [Acinetobacter schindleri]|uniref:hypothetical protein n=1 Tax=Acinetobacter schindleri TaxID=108981 RepID=UPI0013B08FA2|nr:hypothetical protein [Acinetobacter schindleri]QIC64367.1 hypothetical protein FSC11_08310 [Acinetobacter schindleri]
MDKKILFSIMLGALSVTGMATANDKVAKVYNPDLYQKVCKGKSAGDAVTFAHRGIIWNGTCEPQFFSNSKTALMGDEAEIYSACQDASGNTTTTVNGREISGKCALGFTPPRPK